MCVCVCVCVCDAYVSACVSVCVCVWGGGGAVCVSSLFEGSSVKAFMGHGGGGGGRDLRGIFFSLLRRVVCTVLCIVCMNRSFKTAQRLKICKLFHALGILS